jgi:5-methyltetrahydrofolate--homocysteine methyltransferase
VSLSFLDRLSSGEVLIADGATGTNLQEMGLARGTSPEEWVLDAPEKVLALHRAFIAAGAEIILTNSFGGTRLRMSKSRYGDRVGELNRKAALLARQAAMETEGVLVAGSMGPTGSLLQPLGPLAPEQAVEAYAEQAGALSEGGVDLLLVETMYALEEAQAAIAGARRASDLPLVCSFSFDRGEHTMMGVTPEMVVEGLRPQGLAAMGANCGQGLDDVEKVLQRMAGARPGVPLWVKPNAGIPREGEHGPIYDLAPAEMGRQMVRFVRQGARIVGGCCGTTPQHIHAIVEAVHKEFGPRIPDVKKD